MLKDNIRALCPPLIWSVLRRARHGQDPKPFTSFEGRYSSFVEAKKATKTPSFTEAAIAHHAKAMISSLREEREALDAAEQPIALAILYALANRNSPTFRVIDYGGAYGVHYRTYNKIAGSRAVQWTIIEHPLVCSVVKQLMSPIPYVQNVVDAPYDGDLLLASGVAQCIPEFFDEMKKLAALRSAFALFNRVPLTNEPEHFFTVQRISGSYFADGLERRVPVAFFSADKFREALQESFSILWTQHHIETEILDGEPYQADSQTMFVSPA